MSNYFLKFLLHVLPGGYPPSWCQICRVLEVRQVQSTVSQCLIPSQVMIDLPYTPTSPSAFLLLFYFACLIFSMALCANEHSPLAFTSHLYHGYTIWHRSSRRSEWAIASECCSVGLLRRVLIFRHMQSSMLSFSLAFGCRVYSVSRHDFMSCLHSIKLSDGGRSRENNGL
jgi:hypothetical protein